MKIRDEINAFLQEMAPNIPEEAAAAIAEGTKSLQESDILASAKKTGSTAPSFTLPNALKKLVSSTKLLAKGPMVVSFYRGSW